MDKMLQWTLRLGQNVTVDIVNLDVTSRQRGDGGMGGCGDGGVRGGARDIRGGP